MITSLTDRLCPMVIRRAGKIEFLVQLLQQFRLRNAALSGRKIATVENLVIINPFLADSPMRSSKMLYRVFASVFSQLAREIIGHFASVENAQILKQYIVLPKAAAKDEIFFGFKIVNLKYYKDIITEILA